MKVCQNCGTQFDDHVIFCTKCGCKIKEKFNRGKKTMWIMGGVFLFFVVFLFSLCNFVVPISHNENSKMLALVKFDGKYGYIDPSGKFVIPPKYKNASSFSCRRAIVQGMIDNDQSIIDPEGNVLRGVSFRKIENFKYGYAKIYVTEEKQNDYSYFSEDPNVCIWENQEEYSYIDVNGKKMFGGKIFGGCRREHRKIIGRNLMQTRYPGRKPVITDLDGNFKFELPFLYSKASYMKDGLIEVDTMINDRRRFAGSSRILYLDECGKVIIDVSRNLRLKNFKWNAEDFSDGLTLLKPPITAKKRDFYCVIDKKGEIVKILNVDRLSSFCCGYSTYVIKDVGCGILNRNCEVVQSLPYKNIRIPSKNGLIAVKNSNGKWGYIDLCGKVIIDFKFENAFQFCDIDDNGYEDVLKTVDL